MEVKVRDFIEKWTGDYIVENENGAVYGTGGPDGNSLTEDIVNKDIVDIRLERSMWTTKSGDIILIIKDNQ